MKCFKCTKGFKGADEVYRVSACGNDVKGVISSNLNTHYCTTILSTPVKLYCLL